MIEFPERITEFQYRDNAEFVNLVIPPTVKYIGPGAFFNCHNLETVEIPSSVEVVREGAFASCTKLTTITYTDHTVFEYDAFNHCTSLNKIIKDGVEARVFLFDHNGDRAVTIFDPKLSTEEYNVYVGRFADVWHFPNTIIHDEYPVLYFVDVVKDGQSNVWFSTDINVAIIGARYKASGKSFCDFFGIDLTLDTKITYTTLSLMIGSCKSGLHLWKLLCGRDTVEAPMGYILTILKKYSDYFPEIYERTRIAYERSHEVFNYLDTNNIISGKEYMNSLKALLRKIIDEDPNR